ncbi:MAG: hypothetical protein GKS00_28530 [Alphaproteobacteria bacterium]|nr:hypothetical protein [Alphaproteobacteria bacterium]
MTELSLPDPDAILARLLRGRRYDDPYPVEDTAFLNLLTAETDDEIPED